jgi:hypothetical protein
MKDRLPLWLFFRQVIAEIGLNPSEIFRDFRITLADEWMRAAFDPATLLATITHRVESVDIKESAASKRAHL